MKLSDAESRGWGDPGEPGSTQGTTYRKKNIVKITAGGRTLYVHREVSRLFKGFIDEIVRKGYKIDDGAIDDWGYNHRYIRGRERQKVLSNHSWGLAIDLNSRTNPMGDRLVTDMPSWVIECAERWGLNWGGFYKGRKDPMHFEFLGRPHDVTKYPLPAHTEEEEMTEEEREWLSTVHHELRHPKSLLNQKLKDLDDKIDKLLKDRK